MMVSRGRAVVRHVLIWMLCIYSAFCVPASTREQSADQSRQLLALSEKQNQNNHSLALQTAKKALEVSKSLGDDLGVALSLDRKSTRLNSSHSQNLVCRLLLEK